MSHCRWVVIAEDCFEQLQKTKRTPSPSRSQSKPLSQEPPVSSEQEEQKVEERPQTEPKTPEREATPIEEPTSREDRWLQSLPPSFQEIGRQFLEKILEQDDFEVTDKGLILIGREPVPDLAIDQLLRTTCIPFHKGPLPLALQDWFRKKKMTTFQNQLVKILPKWEKRYSLRASTLARMQAPSEAHKRSTKGPKS